MGNYNEGTILFVKEIFDATSTATSIQSISLCKDNDYIESYGGIEGRWQRTFVINCFNTIDEEFFTNKFVFDKKEVKPGDTVYVVIMNDCDPYGDEIIGVFTEKPDKSFILGKYMEHWNPQIKDDNYFEIDEEDYFISDIIEVVIQ